MICWSANVDYKHYLQDKITKQTLMELTLTEQLRERQEMEKKLQKLAKTMDYLERAKREEAAPLIEAAYQQRLVEERLLHEREQQVCVDYYCLHLCLCNFDIAFAHSLSSPPTTLYLSQFISSN